MGELRTRVRSLKIQAGKAERYVEARNRLIDMDLLAFDDKELAKLLDVEVKQGQTDPDAE